MSKHPIIFLWSHPRSMSTAIERIMRERGDCDCLHEPYLHYYYLRRNDKLLPHFARDRNHPSSFREIRDLILDRARQAPVFAKDMSYYVMPELFDDLNFCRRIKHCFLIRNPLLSILSYYKLDAGLRLREIGIEAQWQHYCLLREVGILPGPVVEAEAVQDDCRGIMRRFWAELGLDFRAQAFSWKPNSNPRDWDYVKGWHQAISQSDGIKAARPDSAQVKREFAAVCRQAPQLKDYLDHHLPFYRQLRQYRIEPLQYGAAY